jgi:hypothetical protein
VDPVAEAQLGQDVAHVRLDRGVTDDELAGDLGVGAPGGQQAQHLDLARASGRRSSRVAGAASGSRYLLCAAAKQGASIETALYSCQVTYTLANGTITAAGVARIGASAPVTVAVTGGTGAYAGARGTLTSQSGSDTLTLL